MNKLFLLLFLLLCGNSAVHARSRGIKRAKSGISPARQYKARFDSISNDWMKSADAFKSLYVTQDDTKTAPSEEFLIAMKNLRVQTRRFSSITPVPMSMRVVDKKLITFVRYTDDWLDAAKSYSYDHTEGSAEKSRLSVHLALDTLESATKEMDRILGTTSKPKTYVSG